eukprot:COSAG02_NODE_5312_length_4447_cov_5.535419_4_plen_72_part_00
MSSPQPRCVTSEPTAPPRPITGATYPADGTTRRLPAGGGYDTDVPDARTATGGGAGTCTRDAIGNYLVHVL